MTKKDYELIARGVLSEVLFIKDGSSQVENDLLVISGVAKSLATLLQIENSRFDRSKFLKACGIDV